MTDQTAKRKKPALVIKPGDRVQLAARQAGIFRDELSGLSLSQFGQSWGKVPEGKNLQRVDAAVRLGRLIKLKEGEEPTSSPSIGPVEKDPRYELCHININRYDREAIEAAKASNSIEDLHLMIRIEMEGRNPAGHPRTRVISAIEKRMEAIGGVTQVLEDKSAAETVKFPAKVS